MMDQKYLHTGIAFCKHKHFGGMLVSVYAETFVPFTWSGM